MTGRGLLISVEGIDGTGKTTQVQLLRKWFEERGRKAVALKEPTEGPFGKEISRRASAGALSPGEELRLFMRDREEDVRDRILPALKAGSVVIMDRYYQSNMAYQGARGLDVGGIKEANESFAPAPDLVIVLDIDPRRSLARVRACRDMVGHFENEAYLEKVREIFLRIGREPNAVVIDADAPVEEVHRRITKAVEERLPSARAL